MKGTHSRRDRPCGGGSQTHPLLLSLVRTQMELLLWEGAQAPVPVHFCCHLSEISFTLSVVPVSLPQDPHDPLPGLYGPYVTSALTLLLVPFPELRLVLCSRDREMSCQLQAPGP
jgi:hypothetical protein